MVLQRHGPTHWSQGKVPIDYANDLALTENDELSSVRKAEKIVLRSTRKIIPLLDPKRIVKIHASPYGRTLHTAKVNKELFERFGFRVKIVVAEELGEVRNFSGTLLGQLINGGEVEFEGVKFHIDAEDTNPDKLELVNYYVASAFKKIPESVKSTWPLGYLKKIDSIETFPAVTKRAVNYLYFVKDNAKDGSQYLFITHEALLIAMVKLYTDNKQIRMNPAGFVHLMGNGNGLVVESVNGNNIGYKTDILTALKYFNEDN